MDKSRINLFNVRGVYLIINIAMLMSLHYFFSACLNVIDWSLKNVQKAKFPRFVIGKSTKLGCFKNVKSLQCNYRALPKSWVDSNFFQKKVKLSFKFGTMNKRQLWTISDLFYTRKFITRERILSATKFNFRQSVYVSRCYHVF